MHCENGAGGTMRRRASLRLGLAIAAASLALGGCYTLDRRDMFEVSFRPVTAATLDGLSDAHHRVKPLPVVVDGRVVSAYWDDGDDARAMLVFFDGNGYGAEAAMRRLLIPARALGLDLVTFNYYDQGQPAPSWDEMRRIGRALFDAAAAQPTPAARRILVGGHSLGATFALALAGDRPAAGVFVAAPMTTGVAMVHHQLPLTRLVWLRPDADYAQFDNLRLAARVRVPTLVTGSDGDKALPPPFTDQVFAALPATTTKREVIIHGTPHSQYFARPAFWRAVAEFFQLPASGPAVGYIRAGS